MSGVDGRGRGSTAFEYDLCGCERGRGDLHEHDGKQHQAEQTGTERFHKDTLLIHIL